MARSQRISAAEIIYLRRSGHAAAVYTRGHEVVVDGFKRYTITVRELHALYQANNGFAN